MIINGTGQNNLDNLGITDRAVLQREVSEVVATTPVIDMHTHLYPAGFGGMCLSGIDELLTYHYLVAEVFRSTDVSVETFWSLNKQAQADLIWRTLFVENSPISEATRGVLTVLNALGLNTNANDLGEARKFFNSVNISEHLDDVIRTSRVSDIVMTNDPFDAEEAELWNAGEGHDKRFHAALRLDRLLNTWPVAVEKMGRLGLNVDTNIGGPTVTEIRRFLDKWIAVMKPLYMAVSLPDDFQFPADDIRDRLIKEIILPISREHDLPLALMIGVRRGVNPALRVAGDGLGRADVGAVERICVENPDVRFLSSFLSRENQHELCVAARKFSNLMPFGCWWFLNNPSMVTEITRERLELLGTSFILQHSDSRVLEQLIYKWEHSRRLIAECLFESYDNLLAVGRIVTCGHIERDVSRMFAGNFRTWVGLPAARPVQNGDFQIESVDAGSTYNVATEVIPAKDL